MYDQKVDIFASGLVYFLMLWNMSGQERKNVSLSSMAFFNHIFVIISSFVFMNTFCLIHQQMLCGIKKQIFPEEFTRLFPEEVSFICTFIRRHKLFSQLLRYCQA